MGLSLTIGLILGVWFFILCELGQAKKRKEDAEKALKDAPLVAAPALVSTSAPASSSTALASFKLETLRRYLTEAGYEDNDPAQTSFSLWMTKGDADEQARFVVKSVNGHLNVSGSGDVDGLREDLAQLWMARDREQVLDWLQSHERQVVPRIVNEDASLVTKPTPPIIQEDVRFFIFKPGEAEAQGPFDQSQIEALRTCGVINADTQFCREGEKEWKPSPLL
jgi:hypothetical protein